MLSSSSNTSTNGIRVFRYRWVILGLFGLVSLINFMQLLQFSIIANVVTKYYDVESYWVDLTCVIFFISFILLFYPVSFFIEKCNLKITVLVATGLTLAGNILKLLATNQGRFWLILICQFLIAIGQVQICSIPSKLATTWFGSEDVSTACAISVLFMQLGSALSCIQSPFIVTSKDDDKISSQLFSMFLYQAIITGCIFVLVLVFFRSRPQLPPSQSQANLINSTLSDNEPFLSNMMKVAKNKNFWYVTFSLGLATGIWNSFGVLINTIYLNFFPNGESDAGIIGLVTIISGGCIGCVVVGVILDKTHHFKRISFGILTLSALSFIAVVLSLWQKGRIAAFITVPVFGFFITPTLLVGYEYLVEITYPISEACSASAFNATYYFLSIVATLAFESMFLTMGYMWTFGVIFCIIFGAGLIVLLIDSNLNRRDANLQHNQHNRSNTATAL